MSVDFAKIPTGRENEFFGAWPKESLPSTTVNKNGSIDVFANDMHISNKHCNHHVRRIRQRVQREISLSLIPEYPLLEDTITKCDTPCNDTVPSEGHLIHLSISKGRKYNLMLFMPNLLLKIALSLMRYVLYIPLSIAAPSFWLSAMLWILWKLLSIPISLTKWLYRRTIGVCVRSGGSATAKRTVLISSGSTIQSLHLARNFYSSGARVVVIEVDELFALARFSAAVDKFYIVPRPTAHNTSTYIDAICHIVKKEKPSIYIPVCATSPAYYDALAKPYLELLGCATFMPGLQETIILDDCLQFFQKCYHHDIQLPSHRLLHSRDELLNSHENGFTGNFRNILKAVGMNGLLNRQKFILPNNRREFKFNYEISDQNQWLLIRDIPGDHFITCTTVKDSRIAANVTCRIELDTKKLVPLLSLQSNKLAEDFEIEKWIKIFFAKVRFQRSINGHFSFRMVRCKISGKLLPLDLRVGVSLPYIAYNQPHSHILFSTMKCVHMMQIDIYKDEKDSVLSVLKKKRASMALDKREALFTYWDPLPYCAFYHFQLPLESVKLFLQNRYRTSKRLNTKKVQRSSKNSDAI